MLRLCDTFRSSNDAEMISHSSWLQAFNLKVINHIRAFLSQTEKSHQERQDTFQEIQHHIKALTLEASNFFDYLQNQIEIKVQEAGILLQHHLQCADVVSRLTNWSESDCPAGDLWKDVDLAIGDVISDRIQGELVEWESHTQFFHNLRPYLIDLFELRFVGIQSQMTLVETMLARHDSTLSVPDCAILDNADSGLSIPSRISLGFRSKLILGLMSPLLLPFAITAAVLSLPVLGGIVIRDFITDKQDESKFKDYTSDKVKYLKSRTLSDLQEFSKGKGLDRYIRRELVSACKCIDQLKAEVPRQIKALNSQIDMLRSDARSDKDLAKYYQPLVEIFEHFRQMLVLYKILHLKRDRLEICFSEIVVPPGGDTVCESLNGSITSVQIHRSQSDDTGSNRFPKTVCLKSVARELSAKTIEDYLSEEEAYRYRVAGLLEEH